MAGLSAENSVLPPGWESEITNVDKAQAQTGTTQRTVDNTDLPAVAADNVGHHGQPNPLSRGQRIKADAPLYHAFVIGNGDARPVVLDLNPHRLWRAAFQLTRYAHLPMPIFTGIVEQVAEYLRQVTLIAHKVQTRVNILFDMHILITIDFLKRPADTGYHIRHANLLGQRARLVRAYRALQLIGHDLFHAIK